MSGDRQFQVHQGLYVSAVEVKDALSKVKQPECRHDSDDTQHGGDPQYEAHVPGFGLVLVLDVVISDGQDRSIIEQRQHHDHYRGQWIEVEHEDCQRHEQQHSQCFGDAVDCIAVHSLEDTTTLLDRVND